MSILLRPLIVFLVGIFAYALVLGPFTDYMKQKPIEEKLGYLPTTNVLKYASADHKELVGALLVMKVLMYFGGISEKQQTNVIVQPPDFVRMSAILHGAVKLDPYNMDAYYFAQSFLTWDVKQYQIANSLLDYGMKYRTWDWYLPFFAGFNSAYFLKDYKKAADYYQRAGKLSGQDLHKSLAGRYMQESGQTDLAIGYLSAMAKGERNPAMKKSYETRLAAYREVRRIELARDRFQTERGVSPANLAQLVSEGFLGRMPVDPYGGDFYLQPDGKVASTSKFAFGTGVNKNNSKAGAKP